MSWLSLETVLFRFCYMAYIQWSICTKCCRYTTTQKIIKNYWKVPVNHTLAVIYKWFCYDSHIKNWHVLSRFSLLLYFLHIIVWVVFASSTKSWGQKPTDRILLSQLSCWAPEICKWKSNQQKMTPYHSNFLDPPSESPGKFDAIWERISPKDIWERGSGMFTVSRSGEILMHTEVW